MSGMSVSATGKSFREPSALDMKKELASSQSALAAQSKAVQVLNTYDSMFSGASNAIRIHIYN